MSKFLGLISLVTCVFYSHLQASSLLSQSLEEEIRSASFICSIEIVNSESRLKGDRVETLYRVRKDRDCFKGRISSEAFYILSPGGSYSLQTPQGQQRLTTLVPGAPQFKVKDKQLVYLEATEEADVFRLHSWTHHEVEKDGQSLKSTPKAAGVESSSRAQQAAIGPKTLDEFQQLVSRVLGQSAE